MASVGWIKLHKKINVWEWKKKPLTVSLFIHILLNAEYQPTSIRGVEIPAGSYLTGRKRLSYETGLSEQQVRTALSNLQSTNDITIKSTTEYSIISITNWDKYQSDNQQTHLMVVEPVTTYKRNKEIKKKEDNIYIPENVSAEVWRDFQIHRKAKKAPISPTVIKAFEKEAEKAGISLERAFEISIERNWQGFKAEWIKPTDRFSKQQRNGNDPTAGLTRSQQLDYHTEQALAELNGKNQS